MRIVWPSSKVITRWNPHKDSARLICNFIVRLSPRRLKTGWGCWSRITKAVPDSPFGYELQKRMQFFVSHSNTHYLSSFADEFDSFSVLTTMCNGNIQSLRSTIHFLTIATFATVSPIEHVTRAMARRTRALRLLHEVTHSMDQYLDACSVARSTFTRNAVVSTSARKRPKVYEDNAYFQHLPFAISANVLTIDGDGLCSTQVQVFQWHPEEKTFLRRKIVTKHSVYTWAHVWYLPLCLLFLDFVDQKDWVYRTLKR